MNENARELQCSSRRFLVSSPPRLCVSSSPRLLVSAHNKWAVDPSKFTESMTVTAFVVVDGVPQVELPRGCAALVACNL